MLKSLIESGRKEYAETRGMLAGIRPAQLARLLYTILLLLMVLVIYHFWGNSQDLNQGYGRSALRWMAIRWSGGGGDFSHGYLIPFVSLFLVWRRRQALFETAKRTSTLGLWLIVMALAMHWVGYRATHVRISLFALLLLFFSIPFYIYGAGVAKLIFFPCAYLFFCIPLSFLNQISFPLRLFATRVAATILNTVGISVIRSGTRMFEAATDAAGQLAVVEDGFRFAVADPCSGLHSLIAMAALAALYAYLTQKGWLRRGILFVASMPLAIAGNIARILTIFFVAAAFGQDAAIHIYHDFSGFILFPVATLLMVALGTLLSKDWTRLVNKCKKSTSTPSS